MPSKINAQTGKFEEGRRVVVKSRYLGEIVGSDGATVDVSLDHSRTRTFPAEDVQKWPVVDIPHPLPVNTVVVVVPPNYTGGVTAEVRLAGTDGDGLIYRVGRRALDRLVEVGPEAILDVRHIAKRSPIRRP